MAKSMAEASYAAPSQRSYGWLVILAVALLLLGLPVAAWLDMRELSERILRRQADEISRVIDDMRGFYASDVVGRVMAQHAAVPTHNYKEVSGGIPIPATLSIELGQRISARNDAVRYRFVSDEPFKGRSPHNLDSFEQRALQTLRKDPTKPVVSAQGSLFESVIRLATPVLLGPACVNCHNSHPDSPRRDWKVGDVRGIQEITVRQPIGANIFSFKYLLAYFLLIGIAGISFILLQWRQASVIHAFNRELAEANNFLASISMKIAKYISPQIYKSIFSGERDVAIATERKNSRSSSPISRTSLRPRSAFSLKISRRCSTSISPKCRRSRFDTARRSTNSWATRCCCSSVIPRRKGFRKTLAPAWRWRPRCSGDWRS
jgi:hypothetical protein